MQSGWKSRFTLHKPGDPLKLALKLEQRKAYLVVAVQIGWKSGFILPKPIGGP